MKPINNLKTFPYSRNRIVIIDWASISYHQWHAINTKLKHSYMIDPDDNNHSSFERTQDIELAMWRTGMLKAMMKYVKLFNPIDMLFALEGSNVWRNDIIKDYYNENCIVYYDNEAYYLRYDNFLYKLLQKNGEYFVEKKDFIKDSIVLSNPSKKLNELPQRIQTLMWNTYLPNGITPLLPKYKGKRLKQQWDFITDRKIWRDYKDTFAHEISSVFRSKVISRSDAEGDDIIYVACNYLKNKYDSIVLITGDSDMNQLLTIPNLTIYNHRTDAIVECEHPDDYLELKILQGDSSDNINGIALPNKKIQLGEVGAVKLFESTNNIYLTAKRDGWDRQYRRNQTLIDLSYIPTNIQRNICTLIEDAKTELCELEYMYSLQVNNKIINSLINLKHMGIYSMLDKEYVEGHPDIFNPDQFVLDDISDLNSATSVKRTFADLSNVFYTPLQDGSIF